MAITWGSGGVFGSIGKAIKEANANSVASSSIVSAAVSFVRGYILYNFRYLADLTFTSFDDLWYDGLLAKMGEDTQTVQENTVSMGAIAFTGAGTPNYQDDSGSPVNRTLSETQMLLDDDTIRIVCTSASAGADSWAIWSMLRGRIGATITTGTLFGEALTIDDKSGLAGTILEPESYVTGDTSGIFGAPTESLLLGAEKGVNCDDDGIIYVAVTNDGYGNYSLIGYPTSTDRSNLTNQVFHLASYSTTGSKAVVADNASGLSGTITIGALAADSAISYFAAIAYAVGDTFLIGPASVTDGGVIQTFFRDNFKRCLPESGSPTIADSLAT